MRQSAAVGFHARPGVGRVARAGNHARRGFLGTMTGPLGVFKANWITPEQGSIWRYTDAGVLICVELKL